MKFLDSEKFSTLSSALSMVAASSGKQLLVKLEGYSCKHTSNDKKRYKQFLHERGATPQAGDDDSGEEEAAAPAAAEEAMSVGQSFSLSRSLPRSAGELGIPNPGSNVQMLGPAQTVVSPYGKLQVETCSLRTLFFLASSLNLSFPDYEFLQSDSQNFSKEPQIDMVINSIDSTLGTTIGAEYANLKQDLWSAIDSDISLRNSTVYSYTPENDGADLLAEDEHAVWSFYYFFYNKRARRIVLFTCMSVSDERQQRSAEVSDDEDTFAEMEQ